MDTTDHLRAFLEGAGLGGGDPEFAGTPERVAELLRSFAQVSVRPPTLCATTARSPVAVTGLQFHSLCVHHLLPFFGTVAVGYVPRDHLVGFGSIPRLVEDLSRRLQLQERLTEQVLGQLVEWLAPESAVVVVRARHLCMEMRGARAAGEVFTIATHGAPPPTLVDEVRRSS
jgi:GTP cyclohydrolase I